MPEIGSQHIFVNYVGHISFMTGRSCESIQMHLPGTIGDLLEVLEKKYPGLKDLFIPSSGIFNSRTGIILRRRAESVPVISMDHGLKPGDIVTLW